MMTGTGSSGRRALTDEISLWLLKNSLITPIRQTLGDRKCLGDPRKSIVGLPGAFLFSSILREGVFQQPRDVPPHHKRREMPLVLTFFACCL
jgi:hypothetical protein